jgi:hypothetical protein
MDAVMGGISVTGVWLREPDNEKYLRLFRSLLFTGIYYAGPRHENGVILPLRLPANFGRKTKSNRFRGLHRYQMVKNVGIAPVLWKRSSKQLLSIQLVAVAILL